MTMKSKLLAGIITLSLTGTGLAFAQNAMTPDSRRAEASLEDASAFTDARIAGLKAGLKLTPDQEKNWPAVETALRDLAKQRADRRKAFDERMKERREARRNAGDNAPAPDAIAMFRQGADALTARADSLKKLADASEPLYKSLDDGQKRRFAVLIRGAEGRDSGGPRHGRHHHSR